MMSGSRGKGCKKEKKAGEGLENEDRSQVRSFTEALKKLRQCPVIIWQKFPDKKNK